MTTAIRLLSRVWCRLRGHDPVSVALGWCPKSPLGAYCTVYATCCSQCRHELPVPRQCGQSGGQECRS